MKLNNKIYNWWYQVKRVQLRGSKNAGKMWNGREWLICKYDWSKPFSFTTKKFDLTKQLDWKFTKGINIKMTTKGDRV